MKRRVMLVTGASRGIGAAIARAAGARGYAVGVNYHRSEQAAQQVVDDIVAAGGKAALFKADVGNLEEVERMFGMLDDELGRIDVLMNNAGVLANFRVDELVPD